MDVCERAGIGPGQKPAAMDRPGMGARAEGLQRCPPAARCALPVQLERGAERGCGDKHSSITASNGGAARRTSPHLARCLPRQIWAVAGRGTKVTRWTKRAIEGGGWKTRLAGAPKKGRGACPLNSNIPLDAQQVGGHSHWSPHREHSSRWVHGGGSPCAAWRGLGSQPCSQDQPNTRAQRVKTAAGPAISRRRMNGRFRGAGKFCRREQAVSRWDSSMRPHTS